MEKFKFRCFHVLPLVYDDSLSYYEVLCKVAEKLNEIIDVLPQYEEIVEAISELEEFDSWVRDKIDAIETELSTATSDIDTINTVTIPAINTALGALETYCQENRQRIGALETDNTTNKSNISSLQTTTAQHTEQINTILGGNPTLAGYIALVSIDGGYSATIYNDIDATGVSKVTISGVDVEGIIIVCNPIATIKRINDTNVNRQIIIRCADYIYPNFGFVDFIIYGKYENGVWSNVTVE